MKYWKEGKIKLEEERRDLMNLYFSQTQSSIAWKALKDAKEAKQQEDDYLIKVNAMQIGDTQESVSIYDDDVNQSIMSMAEPTIKQSQNIIQKYVQMEIDRKNQTGMLPKNIQLNQNN